MFKLTRNKSSLCGEQSIQRTSEETSKVKYIKINSKAKQGKLNSKVQYNEIVQLINYSKYAVAVRCIMFECMKSFDLGKGKKLILFNIKKYI